MIRTYMFDLSLFLVKSMNLVKLTVQVYCEVSEKLPYSIAIIVKQRQLQNLAFDSLCQLEMIP
ncbi:hypothetical protein ES319_D06G209200v1 [Gossypium barbadense]|uniref:Uncharacterized protein n=2 Tax=Gossypium TaxID=3633 RepID=A0A5J5R5X0_GOSBA|nr:hypothetical protein ES319_D06G209200v1 [Gossypium barbadense]TYG65862.1 hypothetical protein ES288_D06G221200v1 [Gossypium darwinii]